MQNQLKVFNEWILIKKTLITCDLVLPTLTKLDTNHFGSNGIFQLNRSDSEMPVRTKQIKDFRKTLK